MIERHSAAAHGLEVTAPPPARALRGPRLQELAEREDAAAIVIGSSHRGDLGRVFAGTTAERLLHGAPCPVLVAPRGYAGGELRRIVVGHDGGEEAQGALEVALAAPGQVRLVRVLEPISIGVQASMAGAWIPAVDIETEAREGFEAEFVAPGDAVEREFVVGDPVDELVARSEDADLVDRRLARLRAAALRAAGQRLREARPPGRLPGDGRPARRGGRGRRPARRHHRDRPAGMSPLRVLVAGGGVAGMEAILALRDLAGERVQITLLAPEPTFAYRPMAVAVPFARGHVQRLQLADFARETSTRLVRGELAAVEPGVARTSAGAALEYDALLVAVGARSEPAITGATHVDARARPGGDGRAAGRPRGGLRQARRVRRARRHRLAAAGLRARADDRLGRPRHGPGRRRGDGVHARARSARPVRRAGVGVAAGRTSTRPA